MGNKKKKQNNKNNRFNQKENISEEKTVCDVHGVFCEVTQLIHRHTNIMTSLVQSKRMRLSEQTQNAHASIWSKRLQEYCEKYEFWTFEATKNFPTNRLFFANLEDSAEVIENLMKLFQNEEEVEEQERLENDDRDFDLFIPAIEETRNMKLALEISEMTLKHYRKKNDCPEIAEAFEMLQNFADSFEKLSVVNLQNLSEPFAKDIVAIETFRGAQNQSEIHGEGDAEDRNHEDDDVPDAVTNMIEKVREASNVCWNSFNEIGQAFINDTKTVSSEIVSERMKDVILGTFYQFHCQYDQFSAGFEHNFKNSILAVVQIEQKNQLKALERERSGEQLNSSSSLPVLAVEQSVIQSDADAIKTKKKSIFQVHTVIEDIRSVITDFTKIRCEIDKDVDSHFSQLQNNVSRQIIETAGVSKKLLNELEKITKSYKLNQKQYIRSNIEVLKKSTKRLLSMGNDLSQNKSNGTPRVEEYCEEDIDSNAGDNTTIGFPRSDEQLNSSSSLPALTVEQIVIQSNADAIETKKKSIFQISTLIEDLRSVIIDLTKIRRELDEDVDSHISELRKKVSRHMTGTGGVSEKLVNELDEITKSYKLNQKQYIRKNIEILQKSTKRLFSIRNDLSQNNSSGTPRVDKPFEEEIDSNAVSLPSETLDQDTTDSTDSYVFGTQMEEWEQHGYSKFLEFNSQPGLPIDSQKSAQPASSLLTTATSGEKSDGSIDFSWSPSIESLDRVSIPMAQVMESVTETHLTTDAKTAKKKERQFPLISPVLRKFRRTVKSKPLPFISAQPRILRNDNTESVQIQPNNTETTQGTYRRFLRPKEYYSYIFEISDNKEPRDTPQFQKTKMDCMEALARIRLSKVSFEAGNNRDGVAGAKQNMEESSSSKDSLDV